MVKCARCEVPVFRALLVGPGRARRAVIDAAPDKYGIGPVAAYVDVARSWHARLLEPWQVPANHERRHLEHACPVSSRSLVKPERDMSRQFRAKRADAGTFAK